MRFLHTADWHLGRYFHGVSLLEDQAHALEQVVALAASEKVDAVLIAGDVYDRAIPPADAVALLDDVLSRLIIGHGIPVVLIAGNHDSPDRVAFGGRVAERQRLILRGTLNRLEPVRFDDAHGRVAIHPLPYVEPAFARALPGCETARDHQSALEATTALLRNRFVPGDRNVLIGHAFVSGGTESESERPLTVGGSGVVAVDTFDGFDFVALGHLHRAQSVGSPHLQYSGSLLKYSFNEVDHIKSVSLVDLDAAGAPTVNRVPIRPLRDARIITGTLADLLANPDPTLPRDDYLCAVLTDRDPQLEPKARLAEVYPNLLELRFASLGTPVAGITGAPRDLPRRQPDAMFRSFYRDIAGEELDEAALGVFNESVESVMSRSAEGQQ